MGSRFCFLLCHTRALFLRGNKMCPGHRLEAKASGALGVPEDQSGWPQLFEGLWEGPWISAHSRLELPLRQVSFGRAILMPTQLLFLTKSQISLSSGRKKCMWDPRRLQLHNQPSNSMEELGEESTFLTNPQISGRQTDPKPSHTAVRMGDRVHKC